MTVKIAESLRLLNTFEWMARPATAKEVCFTAADEIERLLARETRLREALYEIEWSNNSEWQSDRARAALGEEKKK